MIMTEVHDLVRHLIRTTPAEAWSVQGFGMMRCYADVGRREPSLRLNIWDPALRIHPEPSDIHSHPWDFRSMIVAGTLTNVKYTRQKDHKKAKPYVEGVMMPGIEGSEPEPHGVVSLRHCGTTKWHSGERYWMRADEIHRTAVPDHCITLNWRWRHGRADLASTFWPQGTEWVSAKPREAEPEEVRDVLGRALGLLVVPT